MNAPLIAFALAAIIALAIAVLVAFDTFGTPAP